MLSVAVNICVGVVFVKYVQGMSIKERDYKCVLLLSREAASVGINYFKKQGTVIVNIVCLIA